MSCARRPCPLIANAAGWWCAGAPCGKDGGGGSVQIFSATTKKKKRCIHPSRPTPWTMDLLSTRSGAYVRDPCLAPSELARLNRRPLRACTLSYLASINLPSRSPLLDLAFFFINTSREAFFQSESGLGLNQNMGFPLYKNENLYYPVSKFVLILTENFSKT